MNNSVKRIFSLILALVMCISMLPASALAEEQSAEPAAAAEESLAEYSASDLAAEAADESEPVAESAPEAQAEEIYRSTRTFINPHYADIITEADAAEQLQASNEELESLPGEDEVDYLADSDAAADMLRKEMAARKESIVIYFKGVTATDESCAAYNESFKKAMLQHTGEPEEGDYILFQLTDYKYSCSGQGERYMLEFTAHYYTDSVQESKLDSEVQTLLANLNLSGKSDYEKVKAIYDYLCDTVKYDNEHDKTYKLQYTAYSALIDKCSVCQGISCAFYRLCLESGIDARIVDSSDQNHAWNIVKLDGKYYELDATWDLGNSVSGYAFFLRGSYNWRQCHIDDNGYSTLGDQFTDTDFAAAYPLSKWDYGVSEYTVSTAEEFTDAVYELNGKDTECRTIILANDITVGNDVLKEDWEEKLQFIGDYQIRSAEGGNYTLTLNCDVATDCKGEGDNAKGSLGVLTNIIVNGQMDCHSYLFVAPDWLEEINAKLTVLSDSTLTIWGDAKVNEGGTLEIENDARLIVKRYLGLRGNGKLVNSGEVVATDESDDSYANICLESGEASYSGSGVWTGHPLRYNQYYEVSTADELIQAVNAMNGSECPGGRTIALKNDIEISDDDSGVLILRGDYNFCSADENEYTLTLNRETRLDCIQVGDNPDDMNGSLSVNLNLVVGKNLTVNAISQIGGDYDGAHDGSITVNAGADFKLCGRCTIYNNGELTVKEGASVSFNEWNELRGEMDVAGTLKFLNETSGMDVLDGSKLNITGAITSANTDYPVFVCENSTVSVPESEEKFVIYQRCFDNVADMTSFINSQDGKNYEAQFEGTGVLESSLTIPDNIQLLLYGYDEDEKTTFTVKSGATLTVGRLLVFAEMVVEDEAAVCIKDGCELQNRSDGCLITNNGTVSFEENSWFKLYGTLNNDGTVTMAENSWFGFYGHCINSGSFTNSGYTDFCGCLEGDGEWNMDGGASIYNYASTEQDFIDAVNRLSECDCNERRLYLNDNITLTQGVTVKGNFRICSDNGYGLTVAGNGKIKVENFGDTCGQLYVEVPLTVEGSIELDYEEFSLLSPETSIMVAESGSINANNGAIYINEGVPVTGLERGAYKLCIDSVSNETELRNKIAEHSGDEGSTIIRWYDTDIIELTDDLNLPAGIAVEISGYDNTLRQLVIPEGKTLTVGENARLGLYYKGKLTVNGTLDWSKGSFEYNIYDGGELVFGDKSVHIPNSAYLEEQLADAFENGGEIISDYPVELTLSEDYTVNGRCYVSTESTKSGNSVITVPSGKTLTISEGNRLILDGGTVLKVEAGGKLVNNGKIIINSGSLEICDGGIYEYAPNSTGLSLNAADNGGSITGISDDVAKEQIEYWRDCADSDDIDEFFAMNKPCKGKAVSIVGAVTLTKDLVIENDDAIVISADNAEGAEETQLIIPYGVTVTVKSWLEQNEATSILIKNGGSLILEDGSYLYQAGPIYVEEGGTLTRGGDEELVSYASTREDLESIISDYRDIVTEDPDANLSIVLDNDIAVEDLDLTGVPLTIDDNWIESQNRNARLTVNGKMTVDSRLTLRIESEFTAGSTLDNKGIIVVLAPMAVNGEYKGHLDGYDRGRLIQPWGPGLAEDIYITGEDMLENITLSGVLGGDDPQSALKSAIAESSPSETGAMELALSLADDTDKLTLTEKISLPENILLVIENGKTLEVSRGGELSVEGGILEADSGSSIINSGAITVNSGELYVEDGSSFRGSLISVKSEECVYYAREEIYFIGIYGDVNGDGYIDILDVNLLRRAAAGLESLDNNKAAAGNVYYDAKNNSLDVNLLRRYIAEIVTQIPYAA